MYYKNTVSHQLGMSALNNGWIVWCVTCAFMFLLFASKLWLIKTYGNATPFWDQWDAEAIGLYKPYLEERFNGSIFFEPHNEHRIFTTRVLALLVFVVNGAWNPLLQMVVNAILHVTVLVLLIRQLAKATGSQHLIAMFGFSLAVFGVPYGWQNTLEAFQSQFYLVQLFGIACLWLTTLRPPLSAGWWSGVICGILAYFSLASGVFSLGAAALIHFLFYITALDRTGKRLYALLMLVTLFLSGIFLTPVIAGHAALKAPSFLAFLDAFIAIMGWPIKESVISAILRNLPAIFFAVVMLKERPHTKDRRWFILALLLCMIGQSMSIAYGRATAFHSSRYLDVHTIFILVNFACLLSIARNNRVTRYLWTVFILASLIIFGAKGIPSDLAFKRETGRQQEVNTRNYLLTGNIDHLQGKAFFDIPYPDYKRLAHILESEDIRKVLPRNINPYSTVTGRLDSINASLIENWFIFMLLGLLSMLSCAAFLFPRRS